MVTKDEGYLSKMQGPQAAIGLTKGEALGNNTMVHSHSV